MSSSENNEEKSVNSKNEFVLFSKLSSKHDDDVWDDEALIRAYDKSIKKIKQSIAGKLEKTDVKFLTEKQSAQASSSEKDNYKKKWNMGDKCMAVYEQDGLLYPAEIIKINKNKKQTCTIRYLYYLNEEEKHLNELQPYVEEGEEEDCQLETISIKSDSKKKGEHISSKNETEDLSKLMTNNFNLKMPPMPPPPPPSFLFDKTINKESGSIVESQENESFYSMLMSWYMAGYHTGYHSGLIDAKRSFSSK